VLNFCKALKGGVTSTPPEEHISPGFRIEEEAKKKVAYYSILKMEARNLG
jgi:hypothetical protein